MESFLAEHSEYDKKLMPQSCDITAMAGVSSLISVGNIKENIFFRGPPIVTYHVDDLGLDFRYFIIKRKSAFWPKEGEKVSVVLFEGIVDCGGATEFNGVIFIK